jgi:hypothetical protein
VFGLTSPVSDDTTIEAWVDYNEDSGVTDTDTRASEEPGGTATLTWAASAADARVSFLNPSGYGGADPSIVSNKTDTDGKYHIVTRVDSVEVPGIELLISANGTTFTKIGDATQVSGTDTWDLPWDVNVNDGSYTLRARITGTTDKIEDRAISVENDAAPPDPTVQPAETAEITKPLNGTIVPFSQKRTTVEGKASAGSDGIDVYYTKVAAKDTPVGGDWIFCGYIDLTQGTAPQTFSGSCRLQGADQASSVKGIAAVPYDCDQPNGCDATPPAPPQERQPGGEEAGDAHRVFGTEGNPKITIEPAETAAEPGTCEKYVVHVTDATGQAIDNQNVDVHATGPTDALDFCAPAEGGSNHNAPQEGGHAVESGQEDEGTHPDETNPDTQHIEGSTNDQGRFVFGLASPDEGDSQLLAWIDSTDNDEKGDSEAGDTALMHWTADTQPPPKEKVASTVTIRYKRGIFKGKVGSAKAECKAGRKVTLKKPKPGADERFGSATTTSTGKWKIKERKAKGTYYVKLSRKRFTEPDGTIIVCKGKRSAKAHV